MNNILTILAIISFIIFIIWNIFEIVLSHRFYKRIEKEYQADIDKCIDEAINNLLGDNNDN